MLSELEEAVEDLLETAKPVFEQEEEIRRVAKIRVRKIESDDEEVKNEASNQPMKSDHEMSEANPMAELTDISKCGPPEPGKKWV